MEPNDLLVSIDIYESNPVHTRISIYSNNKRYGIVTEKATGLSGRLCVDTELVCEYIDRLRPVLISHRSDVSPDTIPGFDLLMDRYHRHWNWKDEEPS